MKQLFDELLFPKTEMYILLLLFLWMFGVSFWNIKAQETHQLCVTETNV
jgi:hypothetical protein